MILYAVYFCQLVPPLVTIKYIQKYFGQESKRVGQLFGLLIWTGIESSFHGHPGDQ